MGRKMESMFTLFAGIATGFSSLLFTGIFTVDAFSYMVLYALASLGFGVLAGISWDIACLSPADSHGALTLVTQYLFIKLSRIFGTKYRKQILEVTKNIPDTQKRNLLRILLENQGTEYGRHCGFKQIKSRKEFREKCPLTTYDDYDDYVNKIAAGHENILTFDPVVFLAVSSGTTGKNKLIPVTKAMANTGKVMAMTVFYMIDLKCGLDLQRAAILRYKPKVSYSPSGLTIAPVTYHLSKHFPFYISPRCVCDVDNEQAALYIHAVFMLGESELNYFDGLMATLVYSFWVLVEAKWHDICQDIESGCIRQQFGVDERLLKEVNGHLKPNPVRASNLREEFGSGFQGISKRIWPNCRYVRMLSTGAFAHYAKILKEVYMEGVYQLTAVHGASEGFMGINIDPKAEVTSCMAVPIYGFLEFIPEECCHEDQPTTLYLEEVTVGECYEMVLTSPMGLYRYRTGDIIRVVDHVNQCPVYEFQYRSGQILNLFWEKTNENTFYQAVLHAAERAGIRVLDYTATENAYLSETDFPEISRALNLDSSIKRYVLFLEADKNGNAYSLSDADKDLFDQSLCDVAELYSSLRSQGSIGSMVVMQVELGTFQQVREQLVAKQQNQQVKMPHVMHDAAILQFLISNAFSP